MSKKIVGSKCQKTLDYCTHALVLAAHQAVLANYAHEVAQSKIITTTLLLIPFCSCLPNKLIFAVRTGNKGGKERKKN